MLHAEALSNAFMEQLCLKVIYNTSDRVVHLCLTQRNMTETVDFDYHLVFSALDRV